MKTNHQRQFVRTGKNLNSGFWKRMVKQESREGMRTASNLYLTLVKKGADLDAIVVPTKAIHVSDKWNWD
jgi:hypothetical protein